jgi:hypothetical protein
LRYGSSAFASTQLSIIAFAFGGIRKALNDGLATLESLDSIDVSRDKTRLSELDWLLIGRKDPNSEGSGREKSSASVKDSVSSRSSSPPYRSKIAVALVELRWLSNGWLSLGVGVFDSLYLAQHRVYLETKNRLFTRASFDLNFDLLHTELIGRKH